MQQRLDTEISRHVWRYNAVSNGHNLAGFDNVCPPLMDELTRLGYVVIGAAMSPKAKFDPNCLSPQMMCLPAPYLVTFLAQLPLTPACRLEREKELPTSSQKGLSRADHEGPLNTNS